MEIRHSDVEGGEANVLIFNNSQLDWGPGMFDADPLFTDADGPDDDPSTWQDNDFTLLPDSPCIDTGDPTEVPPGVDLGGLPRILDGLLDGAMIDDMGAHEYGNVHLAVSGDPIPGGTLTFETTGAAGLDVVLFAGTAPGESLLRPYGSLFLSFASPWILIPWGTIPSTKNVTVPATVPPSTLVVIQELAIDRTTGHGNFSNPAEVLID